MNLKLKITTKKNYPTFMLLVIILLGAFLRFWLAKSSDHIFYADELFQVLEQSFRQINGYGIIPKEFLLGIRSWILPSMVGSVLYISKIIGLHNPSQYILFIKLFLATLSLSLIASLYIIVKSITKSTSQALLSAASISIWYEFIYFSSRPFYEVISTYLIYGSLALLLITRNRAILTISGILASIAVYIRPHYIPIFFTILVIWYIYQPKKFKSHLLFFLLGSALGFILSGLIDKLTWGSWFHSTISYLEFNLGRGVELINDPHKATQHNKTFYFFSIITTSFFLAILSIFSSKKLKPLLLIVLVALISHTFIDHKEYRFIFVSLPVIIALSTITLYQLTKNHFTQIQSAIISLIILSIVSIIGISNRIPGQSDIYYQKMTAIDPVLYLYQQIYKHPEVCGLFDATRPYQLTGGYYYIGRNIPIFNQTYPPNSENSAVNLIITRKPLNLDNFSLLTTHQNLYLYQSQQCHLSIDNLLKITSSY